MLIYRIETESGGGMYQGSYGALCPLTFDSARHPIPENDSLLMDNMSCVIEREGLPPATSAWSFIYGRYRFGFASVDQLRAWVYQDDWLVKLHLYGLRLAVYDVDDEDCVVGYTQAIFRNSEPWKTNYFNILDFFGLRNYILEDDSQSSEIYNPYNPCLTKN
jgi:hypothetical protein